jgi:hypothetical protein
MWAGIVGGWVTTAQIRCGEEGFKRLDPFFDAMIKADSAGAVFDEDLSSVAYDEDDARRLGRDWRYLSGVNLNKLFKFPFDGKTYSMEFWARARAAGPNADPDAEPEIEYRASLPTRHVMAIPASLGPQTPLITPFNSGAYGVWGERSVVCKTTMEALHKQLPALSDWAKFFFLTVRPPKYVELQLSQSGEYLELRFQQEHARVVVAFTPFRC